MKKLLAITLAGVLIVGTVLATTGCGEKKPYEKYDLTEYITLPDYNSYKAEEPNVVIKDSDVEDEIQNRLKSAAKTESVTEGTVDKGDSVTISFKGTLADGSSPSGMNSDSYNLTLGSGGMIDGFESGLYGAKISETVTLKLKFPDPYKNNEELSGKDVTFEVKVLSKNVQKVPEFNLDFVKENSENKTIEEYKAALAKDLEKQKYEKQLSDIKQNLYMKLVDETEVKKYPEKEVDEYFEELDSYYRDQAKSSGYEKWEDFLESQKMTQEDYDKQIKTLAEEYVKQEMVIYLFAKEEKIEVTDKEYDEFLQDNLKSAGFKDEEDFEKYVGMSLEKYAEQAKLSRNMLLTKELDTLYDKLIEAQKGSK